MKEIGEYLRNRRIELGISLEEAEQNLKIRKKYLVALEEGDESILPGRTYFVGYLRNYANYLGIDPDYLNQLLKKTEKPAKPIESEPVTKRKKTGRYFSQRKRRLGTKKEKKPISLLPFIKIAVVIILILGVIAILNQFIPKIKQPSTRPIVRKEVVIPEEKTFEQEMIEMAEENIQTEILSKTPDTTFLEPLPDYNPIEIIVQEPSWVKITQDDDILFEGIIFNTESIAIKSDRLVFLLTSSPNNITVTYNGEVIEPQPMGNHRLISYEIMPSS
ncbi:MAG: helix-turn-helix domain-containing protein [Candidatus Atribacteria bacterium]|nr:helix-turn-helix domain-containing protein [Candidatus Atribacteria bacterium]